MTRQEEAERFAKSAPPLRDGELEAIKPRVPLRPFRTFQEVEQPESEFLLRMDEEGNIGLFEADGGMWKLKARQTVKAFLEEQLAEEVAGNGVYIAL